MDPAVYEDFWSRQRNQQRHETVVFPLGTETQISANDGAILAAARMTETRFSRRSSCGTPPIRIRIVVTPNDPGPVPPDFPDLFEYNGCDNWITLSAGAWGYGFADLGSHKACMILSRSLAEEPWLVSRYFLDHYVTNSLFAQYAMLHASSVVTSDGKRLVILVGPHGAGKSTTALDLTRAGYRFVADGMVLFRFEDNDLIAGGWPIGEVKLRDDMASRFPEYGGRRVMVRGRPKNVVDLLEAAPDRTWAETIRPENTDLVCVELGNEERSQLDPAAQDHVLDVLSANTVYWDDPSRLEANFQALTRLTNAARTFRLRIGKPGGDVGNLLAATGS